MSPSDHFRDALINRGIVPPSELRPESKFHRCDTKGKPGKKDATYLLRMDGVSGGFRNFRDGEGWEDWTCESALDFSLVQIAQHRAQVGVEQREHDDERQKQREAVAVQAHLDWADAKPAPWSHEYLVRKGIEPHTLRIIGADLAVPLRDAQGKIWALQRISPGGKKRFSSGSAVSGKYFTVGEPTELICVTEGVATALSIHQSTGYAVAAAFDCGNLLPVAKALREKYPFKDHIDLRRR